MHERYDVVVPDEHVQALARHIRVVLLAAFALGCGVGALIVQRIGA